MNFTDDDKKLICTHDLIKDRNVHFKYIWGFHSVLLFSKLNGVSFVIKKSTPRDFQIEILLLFTITRNESLNSNLILGKIIIKK